MSLSSRYSLSSEFDGLMTPSSIGGLMAPFWMDSSSIGSLLATSWKASLSSRWHGHYHQSLMASLPPSSIGGLIAPFWMAPSSIGDLAATSRYSLSSEFDDNLCPNFSSSRLLSRDRKMVENISSKNGGKYFPAKTMENIFRWKMFSAKQMNSL